MTTNYHSAVIFAKHTNLLPWFDAKYSTCSHLSHSPAAYDRARAEYARDHDVQLILLVRYVYDERSNCRTYCKIRCPINPLPICGEFEVVSLAQITKLLQKEGWSILQKLPVSLLK